MLLVVSNSLAVNTFTLTYCTSRDHKFKSSPHHLSLEYLTLLGLFVEFLKLSQTVIGAHTAFILRDQLTPAITFLADFEVILGIIVSCIPGLRAWVRVWRSKRAGPLMSEHSGQKTESGTTTPGKESTLEFLTETTGEAKA